MSTPEVTHEGKPTGKSLIGYEDTDGELDDQWYEMMKGVLAAEIFEDDGEGEETKIVRGKK